MEVLHLIPNWFFGINLGFESLFFIFTAVIAFYSFKVYNLSGQEQSKKFGLAFTSLSLSYLFLVFLNSIFLSIMQGNLRALDLDDLIGIKNLAILFYVVFLLLGFITLFYTVTKLRSEPFFISLVLLSIFALMFSRDMSITIYLLSSLFLLLITFFYFREYHLTKNKNTGAMAFSMLCLLFSNISMSVVGNYFLPNLYVFSRFLEIVAYSIIIISLVKLMNNGKKKKQVRSN